MAMVRINSSAVWRAVKLNMAIVVAVLLLVSVAIVVTSQRIMRIELQSVNETDLNFWTSIYAEIGLVGLAETVSFATAAPLGARQIVGLFDLDGHALAGDLAAEPPADRIDEIRLVHAPGAAETIYLSKRALFPDAVLYVGRPTHIIDRTITNLGWILPLAGIAIIASLFATSHSAAVVLGRLLDRIEQTLLAFSAGDATARVPLGPDTDDRFHDLSLGINCNLADLDRASMTLHNTTIAIAHDLRTPLTRASLAIQHAQNQAGLPPEADAAMQAAQDALERLRQTFDTILRISKIGGNRFNAASPAFDLGVLVDEIVEDFGPVFEDAGLRLLAEPKTPALIRGDRRMLGQLVVNLLVNIEHHCPAGTAARIEVIPDGAAVILRVSDDGPGVPEAALRTIFEPFSRLDSSRSKDGAGLGLALVQAIADHHGALVTANTLRPGLAIETRFARVPTPPSA